MKNSRKKRGTRRRGKNDGFARLGDWETIDNGGTSPATTWWPTPFTINPGTPFVLPLIAIPQVAQTTSIYTPSVGSVEIAVLEAEIVWLTNTTTSMLAIFGTGLIKLSQGAGIPSPTSSAGVSREDWIRLRSDAYQFGALGTTTALVNDSCTRKQFIRTGQIIVREGEVLTAVMSLDQRSFPLLVSLGLTFRFRWKIRKYD